MEVRSEPRVQSQKDRQRRIIKCSAEGVVYTIHIVENLKPRMTLQSFIYEQAAANPTEQLTSERDFFTDEIHAKEFLYPDGKGMVRFFAKDDRFYEVRAYGVSVDDPRITTFFSYLSLKKQKNAVEVSEKVQAGAFETNSEDVFTGKEVDAKIRLIEKPDPTYSDEAKSKGIRGTVIIKCVFAANGSVTDIRVIQGAPYGLTEKAVEAARKIKFIPATKDGKNVSMWMMLEYNFNLY